MRARDQVVGEARRLTLVRVDDDERLELRERLGDLRGARPRHDQVLEDADPGFRLVGPGAVEEALEAAAVDAAAVAEGQVLQPVEALGGDGCLGFGLAPLAAPLVGDDHAAGSVEGAGEGVEERDRAAALHAVGVLAGSGPDVGERRSRRGELAGEPLDRARRDRGDPLRPLRCVVGHQLAVLVEAGRPVRHEVVVIELVADDDVGHRQRQRPVGRRPDAHPLVRLGGRVGEVGVDHHHAGPALDAGGDDSPEVNPLQRRGRVPAEEEDVLRLDEVGERALVAHRHFERRLPLHVAQVRVVRVVRCPEERAEVLLRVGEGMVLAPPEELLRVAGLAERAEPVGDLGDRLVPADLDPAGVLVATLLRVGPLHRPLDAVGVVESGDAGVPLGADRGALANADRRVVVGEEVARDVRVVVGVPGVRLDLDRLPLDDVDEDAALASAGVAARGDPLPGVTSVAPRAIG